MGARKKAREAEDKRLMEIMEKYNDPHSPDYEIGTTLIMSAGLARQVLEAERRERIVRIALTLVGIALGILVLWAVYPLF